MLKERGLLIQDEEQALKELHIISYFRLANYLRPMELDKMTHQFKINSYFENALQLYYFDKKLRAFHYTKMRGIGSVESQPQTIRRVFKSAVVGLSPTTTLISYSIGWTTKRVRAENLMMTI